MKMKSILSVAAVATLAIMLGSCKKDYTCECTSTVGEYSTTSSSTINATKKDAESACDANSASAGGATVTCELK